MLSSYALIMLMKWDLCATISNPSGYAIVRVIEATVPRRSPRSNPIRRQTQQPHSYQMRWQTQPHDGGGPEGKKCTSRMVAATPTIKISRNKHDPREDHNSSLYCTIAEIIFAGHINYLSHCFSQRNVSPVAMHGHMC